MNRDEFIEKIESQGYAILEDVLDDGFVARLKTDLSDALQKEASLPYPSDRGMVLLCSLYGRSLIEIFDRAKLIEPFEWILGEGSIVYA